MDKSKHSTSPEFLDSVTPAATFISAASHSYCHPDDETMKRLDDNENIKRIYLTSCVYNRAGINSDFENQEAKLKQKIYSKISDWLDDDDNGELIADPPGGFAEILDLLEKDEKARETAFENLLDAQNLQSKPVKSASIFPEMTTRKIANAGATLPVCITPPTICTGS